MHNTFFLYLFSLLFAWMPLYGNTGQSIDQKANMLYQLDKSINQSAYKEIISFIENKLNRNSSCYLIKETTNLACTVEYVKEKEMIFIHLENFGHIGRGLYKNVTRSILYDQKNPIIVAHAVGCSCCLKKDLQWIASIQNMQGIAKVIALSNHHVSQEERNNCLWTQKKIHTDTKQAIIYKYYNQGSFRSAVLKKKNRGTLSTTDKLKISCDILEGIKNLHKKGIVHLDIKPENILIHKQQNSIEAAITDMGGAFIPKPGIRPRKNGHGTPHYSPPEGFIAIENISFQYHKGFDVYAAGCILYMLFYEKIPSWVTHIRERIDKQNPGKYFTNESQQHLINMIKEAKKTRAENSTMQQVNSILFRMLNPNYKKRTPSKQAFKKFQNLYSKNLQKKTPIK